MRNSFITLILAFGFMAITVFAADTPSLSWIEGCYEPPTKIDSGVFRLTTFEHILIMGTGRHSSRYLAITSADERGRYEFLFFDNNQATKRYRIAPKRNLVKSDDTRISFSVRRRVSGEGGTWTGTSMMTLAPAGNGDLHVDLEITTVNRSFFVFSRTERKHTSFDLKRLPDRNISSLEISGEIDDLPGPASEH